jgi:hypothetical protein
LPESGETMPRNQQEAAVTDFANGKYKNSVLRYKKTLLASRGRFCRPTVPKYKGVQLMSIIKNRRIYRFAFIYMFIIFAVWKRCKGN